MLVGLEILLFVGNSYIWDNLKRISSVILLQGSITNGARDVFTRPCCNEIDRYHGGAMYIFSQTKECKKALRPFVYFIPPMNSSIL